MSSKKIQFVSENPERLMRAYHTLLRRKNVLLSELPLNLLTAMKNQAECNGLKRVES